MLTITVNSTKQWLKNSHHPMVRYLVSLIKGVLYFELPAPRLFLSFLYQSFCLSRNTLSVFTRIFIWTPLFRGRVGSLGKRLNLYGGLPYISGPLRIEIGANCRISGQSTFSGRSCSTQQPLLSVGDNVDIGWMTTIAVGSKVTIADNVRIAGRALLAGYPGHPINAQLRAQGAPELDEQVGEIILERDVWLATGVTVMAGVTIGRGTIIAAGSVVTHDIPPMVLAAGVPAKIIREITA